MYCKLNWVFASSDINRMFCSVAYIHVYENIQQRINSKRSFVRLDEWPALIDIFVLFHSTLFCSVVSMSNSMISISKITIDWLLKLQVYWSYPFCNRNICSYILGVCLEMTYVYFLSHILSMWTVGVMQYIRDLSSSICLNYWRICKIDIFRSHLQWYSLD